MSETQSPISWGDEIKPDSVFSWSHLGYDPGEGSANTTIVVLSRDGSRRIVRARHAGVARLPHLPQYAVVFTPDRAFQSWEGIKIHIEWVKDDPAQTVLLMQTPRGEGVISRSKMSGLVHAERRHWWTDQARDRPSESDPGHEQNTRRRIGRRCGLGRGMAFSLHLLGPSAPAGDRTPG